MHQKVHWKFHERLGYYFDCHYSERSTYKMCILASMRKTALGGGGTSQFHRSYTELLPPPLLFASTRKGFLFQSFCFSPPGRVPEWVSLKWNSHRGFTWRLKNISLQNEISLWNENRYGLSFRIKLNLILVSCINRYKGFLTGTECKQLVIQNSFSQIANSKLMTPCVFFCSVTNVVVIAKDNQSSDYNNTHYWLYIYIFCWFFALCKLFGVS